MSSIYNYFSTSTTPGSTPTTATTISSSTPTTIATPSQDGPQAWDLFISGCRSGNTDHIATVLAKNWGHLNYPRVEGEMPLHTAVANGKVEAVRQLVLDPFGPDIQAVSTNGATPLHVAVRSSSWVSVEKRRQILVFLLESGANVDAKNHDGETPLHIAARRIDKPTNEDVVSLLLEYCADWTIKDFLGQDLAILWREPLREILEAVKPKVDDRFHLAQTWFTTNIPTNSELYRTFADKVLNGIEQDKSNARFHALFVTHTVSFILKGPLPIEYTKQRRSQDVISILNLDDMKRQLPGPGTSCVSTHEDWTVLHSVASLSNDPVAEKKKRIADLEASLAQKEKEKLTLVNEIATLVKLVDDHDKQIASLKVELEKIQPVKSSLPQVMDPSLARTNPSLGNGAIVPDASMTNKQETTSTTPAPAVSKPDSPGLVVDRAGSTSPQRPRANASSTASTAVDVTSLPAETNITGTTPAVDSPSDDSPNREAPPPNVPPPPTPVTSTPISTEISPPPTTPFTLPRSMTVQIDVIGALEAKPQLFVDGLKVKLRQAGVELVDGQAEALIVIKPMPAGSRVIATEFQNLIDQQNRSNRRVLIILRHGNVAQMSTLLEPFVELPALCNDIGEYEAVMGVGVNKKSFMWKVDTDAESLAVPLLRVLSNGLL